MADVNEAGPRARVDAEAPAEGGLRFRLFGIPVSLELSFFIVLGVLGFLSGGTIEFAAAWVALGFVSILVHELGHAFAYRAFGIQPRIRLIGFGGLTYGAELSPGRSIVVSAAGPASGLLLGGAIWLLTTTVVPPGSYEIALLVVVALFMNIGWSLFNLLPILPLDGSHIAIAILRKFTPSRAEWIGIHLSLVMALVVAVVAFWADQVFIAGFVLFLALGSWQARGELVAGPRDHEVLRGWERLDAGDVEAAATIGRTMAADRRAPKETTFRALELTAWTELARGDRNAALDAFRRLGHGAVGSELLRRMFGLFDGDVATGLAAALAGWRSPTVLALVMRVVMERDALGQLIAEARTLEGDRRAEVLFLTAIGLREAGYAVQSAAVRAELSSSDVVALGQDPSYDVLGSRAAAVITSS